MSVIEITTKIGCKVACTYCPQEKLIKAYLKKSNLAQMSLETFKICIDKIPAQVDVVFSGMCEPFLNPDCTKMILYAYEQGHKVGVDTTLIGMSLSNLDSLKLVPFKFFSIHLPSGEGLEQININEDYLILLEKISKSNSKIFYKFHGNTLHPQVKSVLKNNIINWSYMISRAGNIAIENRPGPGRLQGIIGCMRNLCWNILLPNGNVLLCSSDYAMQHILGNLLSSDYDSLLRSEELLKIKEGLRNGALDILCRYCDTYAYKAGRFGKIGYYCRKVFSNIHSFSDFRHFLLKAVLKPFLKQ